MKKIILAVALGMLVPSSASAATVNISGGTLTYTGGSEANSLRLDKRGSGASEYFDVGDAANPGITASSGCYPDTSGHATCQATGVNRVVVNLNGGDDAFTLNTFTGTGATPITVNGGEGNDGLAGSTPDRCDCIAIPETLNGGNGIDNLTGNGGDDVLAGGEGSDNLSGGPGADVLTGGAGSDTLSGGDGVDAQDAGDDSDTISTRDSLAEGVTCGDGTADTVTADTADTTGTDCEAIDKPAPEVPESPTGDPSSPTSPGVAPAPDSAPGSSEPVADAPAESQIYRLSIDLEAADRLMFDSTLNTIIKGPRAIKTLLAGETFRLNARKAKCFLEKAGKARSISCKQAESIVEDSARSLKAVVVAERREGTGMVARKLILQPDYYQRIYQFLVRVEDVDGGEMDAEIVRVLKPRSADIADELAGESVTLLIAGCDGCRRAKGRVVVTAKAARSDEGLVFRARKVTTP